MNATSPQPPSSTSTPVSASPHPRTPSREGDLRDLQGLLKVVAIAERPNFPADDARASRAQKVASSTSSIYATSAISQPNFLEITKSVAFVVQCTLASTDLSVGTALDDECPYFDERYYWPDDKPRVDTQEPPATVDQIASFIGACIKRASFSCEVLVIALVLFNRFVCFAMHPIKPHTYTWKLLFVCSLLLAQKIWDDESVENTDFPLVWKYAMQTKVGALARALACAADALTTTPAHPPRTLCPTAPALAKWKA
jgi:hypothetical protein